MRSGETLVLSGFISRDQMNGMDKLPGAGDMPIIGELFKSRKFQNNETELVIFVRPVVVNTDNPQLQARVNRSKAIIDSSFEQGPIINVEVQDNTRSSRLAASESLPKQAPTQPLQVNHQVKNWGENRAGTKRHEAPQGGSVERPQYTTELTTSGVRSSAWNPVLRYNSTPIQFN